MMLMTPGGNPASVKVLPIAHVTLGQVSEPLSITVLPAAIAYVTALNPRI